LRPLLHVPVTSTGQAKVEQLSIKICSSLFFNACSTYMYSLSLFAITLGISHINIKEYMSIVLVKI